MSNTTRPVAPSRSRRTTKPANRTVARWYPQRRDFATYQQWDTLQRAYEAIYALQDQLAATQSKLDEAQGKIRDLADQQKAAAGKVSATHLNGIAVQPGVPTNGQRLTYYRLQYGTLHRLLQQTV